MKFLLSFFLLLLPFSSSSVPVAPSCKTRPQGIKLAVSGYPDQPAYLQVASWAAPLIIIYHGLNGCPAYIQGQTGLNNYHPNISILWLTAPRIPSGRAWNTGPDGIRYTRAAIIASWLYPVHLWTLGMSNGAGMATVMACKMPEIHGAIVDAGWASVDCSFRKSSQSLLVIGGDRDTSSGPNTPHILASMWLKRLSGCSKTIIDPPKRITYCNKSFVEEVILPGVGHEWPLRPSFNATNETIRVITKDYINVI